MNRIKIIFTSVFFGLFIAFSFQCNLDLASLAGGGSSGSASSGSSGGGPGGGTPATCGDGICNYTQQEFSSTCPQDCGSICGDGVCNGLETSTTCWSDCGSVCGDGVCNGMESVANCQADCSGASLNICGDGICNGSETSATCPTDCGAAISCGDGICNGTETATSCAIDCAGYCGDGICSTASGEDMYTCASDCTPPYLSSVSVSGNPTGPNGGYTNGNILNVTYVMGNMIVGGTSTVGLWDDGGATAYSNTTTSTGTISTNLTTFTGSVTVNPGGQATLVSPAFLVYDGLGTILYGWLYDSLQSAANYTGLNVGTLAYFTTSVPVNMVPIYAVAAVCGDGVCNGSETTATCPSDCPALAPTVSSVTISEASHTVSVNITASDPSGLYYIEADIYDTNGTYYNWGSTYDYSYPTTSTSYALNITDSALAGTVLYATLVVCDSAWNCSYYYHNTSGFYDVNSVDTGNVNVATSLPIPTTTVAPVAPTVSAVTMTQASGMVSVSISANAPGGLFYIEADIYGTTGTYYNWGSTYDYTYPASSTYTLNITHSAPVGVILYPWIYICDAVSQCSIYSYNASGYYDLNSADTNYLNTATSLLVPVVTVAPTVVFDTIDDLYTYTSGGIYYPNAWYSYACTAGQQYSVYWDDSFSGSGTYAGDVQVSIWDANGYWYTGLSLFTAIDSGYYTPSVFTDTADPYGYNSCGLMVEPFGGTYIPTTPGYTYRIWVTTP